MKPSMIPRDDGISLYLHVPFCDRRCDFCGFFTRARRDDRVAVFVSDLLAEIHLRGRTDTLRGRTVETIYFGGGTPSTLSPGQLLSILEACQRSFVVDPAGEVSIEANPASVEYSILRALREGGFTRLSLGAQSFDDPELKAANTPHTTQEIVQAVGAARRAGFANLNLDLIYGLPGQSLTRWLANLDAAITLAPEHLAFYGLTIEEGTQLHREVERGQLNLPDEDALADMYREGRDRLRAAGYLQYEVSNFARPGHACRHNLGYWTDREWLGLGPSAHSYLDGARFSAVASLEEYHRLVSSDVPPVAEKEPGTPDLRLREAVAFGLRMVAGVACAPLHERYGLDPIERFREPIERLTRDGWVVLDDKVLRASDDGLMLADELAVAFMGSESRRL
jgi:putative oxygen-independent coproporphyrinogen III oxidase